MTAKADITTKSTVAGNLQNAGRPSFFQPRTIFTQPGEADNYKDENAIEKGVIPMQNFASAKSFFMPPVVQRKCAHCEKEEKKLQRKENDENNANTTADTENYLSSLQGGKNLGGNEEAFFESRLGYDFSNVQLHTNDAANQSAKNINARAYTYRNNIVFGAGQYQPKTNEGKKLIAHELTHVVQQTNNAPTGILQRDDVAGATAATTSTTTTTGTTGSTTPTSSTVNIAANCNQTDITDIVNQTLTWLDDIYQQLLEFNTDEVFKDAIAPRGNYARIAGALQQAFNTNDVQYAEVIRRRFLHVAQLLRSPGRISINCDRTHCTSGGSSFVAAYVIGPYALTMCSVGIAGSRPVATFIHELMHATIPQVGISNTVTQNTGINDRAYRTDRIFQHLSPEETLDNADSYGILAELLHARANTQIVTPQADTTAGCSQPDILLEAFARAAQWAAFAQNGLQTDVTLLNGAALNTLNSANLDLLNRSFPSVTTTAELVALNNAFQSLQNNGFNNTWDLSCAGSGDRNCSGAVAYASEGKVSASSVTLRQLRTAHTLTVCTDWFTLSADDRIKTVFAAFMLGRPSWIVRGFNLADALQYAEGARHMTNELIPQPTTTSAQEHIDSDMRFRQSHPTTP
jgi:hypothetical protein